MTIIRVIESSLLMSVAVLLLSIPSASPLHVYHERFLCTNFIQLHMYTRSHAHTQKRRHTHT